MRKSKFSLKGECQVLFPPPFWLQSKCRYATPRGTLVTWLWKLPPTERNKDVPEFAYIDQKKCECILAKSGMGKNFECNFEEKFSFSSIQNTFGMTLRPLGGIGKVFFEYCTN